MGTVSAKKTSESPPSKAPQFGEGWLDVRCWARRSCASWTRCSTLGVTQTVAARVLGVSRRTVQRALGRRRRERPETLAELLAALPPLDVVLALPAPAPAPRRNLRGDDWQAAATELETQFPDRWRRS